MPSEVPSRPSHTRSTSYKKLYERQKEWADKIKEKREIAKHAKDLQKDENCTFRPKINKTPK